MSMSNDILHNFAKAVVARQSETDDGVDEEIMKAVALDLGMSEEDLLRAQAEGQQRKLRAQTLRKQGLLEEALSELEQAHAFSPLDIEASVLLADALVKRGRKNDSDEDLQRARALCRQALRAAPANTEAAAILNVIQNNPTGAAKTIPPGLVIAVALVVGILGAVLVALSQLLG